MITRWLFAICLIAFPHLVAICLIAFPHLAIAGDWMITPWIAAQETFTDNLFFTSSNRRADLITGLSPGLSITGDSARLHANLSYSPTLALFAFTPNQNFLGHNLYANGEATLVPDWFFFDARGYMALQPNIPGVSGAFNPSITAPTTAPTTVTPQTLPSAVAPGFVSNQSAIPRSLLSQVSSFTASPFLAHRFGDLGSAEMRYTVNYTDFSGSQNQALVPSGFLVQNTNSLINEGSASFVTGETFGRFQARFLLDAAQSSGTGVFNNASQTVEVVDTGYRIDHSVTALASIGHENLRFSGFPPVRIDDAIWGVGAQFTPSPDLTLIVNYGHRNGTTAPSASLNYNITGRTTLSASYSEGISTITQDIANNLAISDINASGQIVDSRTGVPLSLLNPVLGLQAGVFLTKQLTATATTSWERDRVTNYIYHQDNAVLAQSTPGSGVSQETTGTTLTWSHDVNPLTTTNVSLGYARINLGSPTNINLGASTNANETLITAGVSVSYLLGPSLTSWASYSYLDRSSPQPLLRAAANVITVGVRKDF
jgi:uncharacterized protein (PEP-CTERM system associated)